jgi:hypothetical protein
MGGGKRKSTGKREGKTEGKAYEVHCVGGD